MGDGKLRFMLSAGIDAASHHHESRHRMAAVGSVKGNGLIIGVPRSKSHPQHKKLYKEHSNSRHAEHDLLLRAKEGELDCIVVVRVWRNGKLAMAKPCDVCAKLIKELHPKAKVYYTDHSGELVLLNGN